MDISHAQRAEAALTQMLVSVGDCSAADLRRDLETSKAIGSKLAAYQARAAAALAALERHGDGGAGVLRHATGVSRRRAESQARTARVLEDMPAVREALEDGRVTFANAARLAQAAEGTGSGAVEADASLLAKAESMTDDRFAREARRWTASHQPDDGEADYQRRRARRWLRLWDGDDGMTQLRGELDPVTGERIRNRLEAEARRLRRAAGGGGVGGVGEAGAGAGGEAKGDGDGGDGDGGDGDGGDGDGKPTFAQAMADSLDGLTAIGSSVGGLAGDGGPYSRGNGGNGGACESGGAGTPAREGNPNNRDSDGTAHAADDTGTEEPNPSKRDGSNGGSPTGDDPATRSNDNTGDTDSGDGSNGGSPTRDDPATRSNDNTGDTSGGDGSNGGSPTRDDPATRSNDNTGDTGNGDGSDGGSPTGDDPATRSNDNAGDTDSGDGASTAVTGNAARANNTNTGGSHHDSSGVSSGSRDRRTSDNASDPDPAAEATSTNTGGSRRDNGAGGGSGDTRDRRTSGSGDSDCSCGRRKASVRPIADIAVVSHVDSATGDLVSQLATGEPLPPSVLEMLACNAAITGVLYDTAGTPLWRGTTKRTATAAQLKALIARDGGCVGCGCHPALCQAHHIRPASQGGPTTISNMVLLCWYCHQRVHHNQWTVARRHGRFEVLPPVRTRWGPARAP